MHSFVSIISILLMHENCRADTRVTTYYNDFITRDHPTICIANKICGQGSDAVEVFKINDNGFSKVISLPCKGHPVGVDIFEDDDKLEAWVCNYSNGSIRVLSFRKRQ